jgi:hypothetical protein
MNNNTKAVCDQIKNKMELKMSVYKNVEASFELFKNIAKTYSETFQSYYPHTDIDVKYECKQPKSFQLRFGSDILYFTLHSNVFEFNRDHELMRMPYIREDKDRSYCGMICIYNFLTDSVQYNRQNDVGYLIGRIFINKENHCYIDGKREVGQVYHNFSSTVFNQDFAVLVLEAAIQYTVNFDLLVPPYEVAKEISIGDMMDFESKQMYVKTGKRLGFRFQADIQ